MPARSPACRSRGHEDGIEVAKATSYRPPSLCDRSSVYSRCRLWRLAVRQRSAEIYTNLKRDVFADDSDGGSTARASTCDNARQWERSEVLRVAEVERRDDMHKPLFMKSKRHFVNGVYVCAVMRPLMTCRKARFGAQFHAKAGAPPAQQDVRSDTYLAQVAHGNAVRLA